MARMEDRRLLVGQGSTLDDDRCGIRGTEALIT
jgi:hypothetical protein